MAGQVVDTETAEEFMREVATVASAEDIVAIVNACSRKGDGFAALLGDGRARAIGHEDLRRVLRSIFSTRRFADAILAEIGPSRLAVEIDNLLHGVDAVPDRFDRFDSALAAFANPGFDLPGELLHFTYPDRYWSWTRWMWDPHVDTGALRLVTMEEFELAASGRGETYLRVGQAIAFVQETGRAAGFVGFGAGPFAADVFLACVYGVYMYTVLRMRLTQEFNKVVPELPDLVRRLMGVYRPEV